MFLKSRFRSIFLCLVLELGAITGVPMPPEKIRTLLDAMNQPNVTHVLPEEDGGGAPPDPPAGTAAWSVGTSELIRSYVT